MPFKNSILILALALALAGCEREASDGAGPQTVPAAAGEAAAPADPARPEPEAAAPADPARPEPEAAASADPAGRLDQTVAATVNGVPITNRILDSQLALAEADRLAFGAPPQFDSDEEREAAARLRRLEMLGNLVSLEMACQEALRLGYTPAEAEVEESWESLKKEYGDPAQLTELLENFGVTEDDLRNQLIRTMALQKWQENNFLAQIAVSDQEAREFYDQNQEMFQHGDQARVRQIFLSFPLVASTAQKKAARDKAEAALKKIRAGTDFGTVAAEMSEAPEAAKNRGDLGWLNKDRVTTMFDQAIFALKPGQISPVLESPMGFYIFEVTDTRPAGLEPFESARPELAEMLSEEKLQRVLSARLLELYRQADIQVLDPELKELYDGLRAKEAAAPTGDGPAAPPAPAPDSPQ